MAESSTQPTSLLTIGKRGLVAVGASVIVNSLFLWAVRTSAIVEPFGALTFPPVIFLTILGATAATAVYGAMTRISPHPDWVYVRVAAVALLLSFLPDLGVLRFDPEATVGAVIVLMAMHVTVAVICVVVLTDEYGLRRG